MRVLQRVSHGSGSASQRNNAVRMPSCLSKVILLAAISIALCSAAKKAFSAIRLYPPIWKGLTFSTHQDSLDCHGQLQRSMANVLTTLSSAHLSLDVHTTCAHRP
jgi:hypothetical protein